jgi:hypothetical protein
MTAGVRGPAMRIGIPPRASVNADGIGDSAKWLREK